MTPLFVRRLRCALLFACVCLPFAAWAGVPARDLTAHWSGLSVVAEVDTRGANAEPHVASGGVFGALTDKQAVAAK